jgi:hypothetical protein
MEIPKFGKIDPKDFQKSVTDTSVSAVILFEVGEAKFGSDATGIVLYFERHVRIKILKKSGYEWANETIPLFGTSNGNRD